MFRSSSVGQRPTSSVPPGTRSQLQNGAVQRGLGALPPTSRNGRPAGGGTAIFASVLTLALLATITKAPKVQEIAVLFSGLYLSYNERETGLTVPCLSCHARSCKLSAGPLIAAFDLRRLKHRSASVYSCNKAS